MANRNYQLSITVTGYDRASGPLSRIGASLGRLSEIVGGLIIANAFYSITNAIQGMGAAAYESYTEFERMEVSLGNMLAAEVARGEEVVQVSQAIRKLTEEERQELVALRMEHETLSAEVVYLTEKQAAAIEKFGEGSYQALRLRDRLFETRGEVSALAVEIADLENAEGQLINVTERFMTNQMSLDEALEATQEDLKGLVRWVEDLAVLSPFDESDITTSLRLGAAYGFTLNHAADLQDQQAQLVAAQEDNVVSAQRLTSALIDTVAATGLPSEYMRSITIALGQIQAKGKLAAQEVNQLVNAGIGVEFMARAMGVTAAEFDAMREDTIEAADFIPALVAAMEKDFAGASERVLGTLGGIVDAMGDLRRIASRDLLGPVFRAAQPYLVELFEYFEGSRENLAVWGETLAEAFVNVVEGARYLAREVPAAIERGLGTDTPIVQVSLELAEVLLPESFQDSLDQLKDFLENAELGFAAGNMEALEGAFKGIAVAAAAPAVLGLLKALAGMAAIFGGPVGAAVVGTFAAIGAAWGGDFLGIRTESVRFFNEEFLPAFREFIPLLEENLYNAYVQAYVAYYGYVYPHLRDFYTYVTENIIPMFSNMDEKAEAAYISMWVAYYGYVYPVLQDFAEMATGAYDALVNLGNYIRDEINVHVQRFNEFSGTTLERLAKVGGVALIGYDGMSQLRREFVEISDHLSTNLHFWKTLVETVEALLGPFAEGNLVTSIRDFGAAILDVNDGMVLMAGASIGGLLLGVLEELDLMVFNLIEGNREFYDMLSDIGDMLKRIATEFLEELVIPALEDFWEWVDKITEPLQLWIDQQGWLEESIGTITGVIWGFIAGPLAALETILGGINSYLETMRGLFSDVGEAARNFDESGMFSFGGGGSEPTDPGTDMLAPSPGVQVYMDVQNARDAEGVVTNLDQSSSARSNQTIYFGGQ